MSQVRCHHCRAHLATISALLLTLEAMPRIIDGIVADHQAHCTVLNKPRPASFDEFLWLTETMGVGWGDAARRCGYKTFQAISRAAYRRGRLDLARHYESLHNQGATLTKGTA